MSRNPTAKHCATILASRATAPEDGMTAGDIRLAIIEKYGKNNEAVQALTTDAVSAALRSALRHGHIKTRYLSEPGSPSLYWWSQSGEEPEPTAADDAVLLALRGIARPVINVEVNRLDVERLRAIAETPVFQGDIADWASELANRLEKAA